MGRVIRPGTVPRVNELMRSHHGKRTCASAPAVPANVALSFHTRRTLGPDPQWRARATWDAVTVDVAGRPISVESYQVQLRETDASGDPAETSLQDQARTATGADFTVQGGSAPVNKLARELNASGDIIKKTITGLTTGLATQVNFYAREDVGGSAPLLKFDIWNVTDGTSVASRNFTLDGIWPKLYVRLSLTPAAGKTYEARVSWVSGSGIGLLDHIQWHDLGNAAVWRANVASDESPLDAVFPDIPHPRSGFYQTRLRALNRIHGAQCWSAWSAWTTAQNPVSLATVGPPAPTGVVLVLDKVEGSRPRPWRAKVQWNEIPWWVPPDSDPVFGAASYHVRLAVSNNGGTTTANVRRKTVESTDPDANTTANAQFLANIRGKRHYRTQVAAFDAHGRIGAYSAWTAWASPGGVPNPPINVTWSNPTPAVLRAKWDDPTDPSDIDKFRVRVYRKPGPVLVEDAIAYGNRFTYHIPAADRANVHFVRVTSIEGEIILDVDEVAPVGWDVPEVSTDVDSSDVTPTAVWTSAEAPPSDGTPPASSPTPTLYGGPGYIAVKWTAIANADVTTYEVHASTTTGFTPGAGTLAGQIDGTLFFLRKLPAGTDLAYGTTYYVKLIAKDRDGAAAAGTQASAQMVQVNTPDIAVDAVTANEINVATLSAISANLGTVTAGTFQTGASGTYWEMSSTVQDQLLAFVATNDVVGAIVVADNLLRLLAPRDTAGVAAFIDLISGATAGIDLLADVGGLIRMNADEIKLWPGFQSHGYCAVQAYNDNASSRTFGNGVQYSGVTQLTNVPSSITFSTVGTDLNAGTPAAGDIHLRGFRFTMDINGSSPGRGTRIYTTVGA